MKRRRKTRSGMGFVFLAVLIMLAVLSVKKAELEAKSGELMKEKAKCEREVENLTEEENKIEEYRNYVNSDEYIEDIARKKLGLVYPDEYVFEAEE
ncbi:MAG: hypothetical protein HFH14_10105 [Lachnospiraceae bacterium]|nr:hypothetical protein [Lachnospiraceae bacterium]